MEKLKRTKMKAGAFAVAMLFLVMTAATTITSAFIVPVVQHAEQAIAVTPGQQESQNTQSTPSTPQLPTQYFDEEIQYPSQLPSGTSSLTWIRARRAFNPWDFPVIIYDVGFSVQVMRLRNGPSHWWHFVGQVVITYTGGQPNYIMPIDDQMTWDGQTPLGLDIVSGAYHDLGYFSTAHLTGTVYKDLGAPEYKDRWFYGGQFYGCDPPGGGQGLL